MAPLKLVMFGLGLAGRAGREERGQGGRWDELPQQEEENRSRQITINNRSNSAVTVNSFF